MNRRLLCRPTGCYTRESICSRTDQGWNDSDQGPYKQTDEGNVQEHERFFENGCHLILHLCHHFYQQGCVFSSVRQPCALKDRLHFKQISGKVILIMSECSSNGAL